MTTYRISDLVYYAIWNVMRLKLLRMSLNLLKDPDLGQLCKQFNVHN
jgi:hypothetical protein